MKTQITLFVIAIILSITSSAQITLEHTYSTAITPVAGKYYISNTNTSITIYNSNHSIYKTINIYPSIGNTAIVSSVVTSNLFNNDSKLELIVSFIGSSSKVIIINEDGTIIKDFIGASSAYPTNINGSSKLIVLFYNSSNQTYSTKIYNLTGTLSINTISNSTIGQSYPNPAQSTVTIPYELVSGATSTMYIYNSTGVLMEQLQIDSNFNSIKLNTSNYTAGLYYYVVNGITKKMIVF